MPPIREPEGELEHVDPYTLLVAVVLSAQATDAGVNKATPALFAAADTPEKMVALGEAKVRNFIKTIGLFNTKAKNVIALSQNLIEDHGGKVPPSREALEHVARRRPQDRQCRAQRRLRRADHRGRHPYLPRRQPHRAWRPARPRSRWSRGCIEVVPDHYKKHAHHWLILHGRYVCVARRPLVREMRDRRPVQMAGKNGGSLGFSAVRAWRCPKATVDVFQRGITGFSRAPKNMRPGLR